MSMVLETRLVGCFICLVGVVPTNGERSSKQMTILTLPTSNSGVGLKGAVEAG